MITGLLFYLTSAHEWTHKVRYSGVILLWKKYAHTSTNLRPVAQKLVASDFSQTDVAQNKHNLTESVHFLQRPCSYRVVFTRKQPATL
jgi:hypothetical protein